MEPAGQGHDRLNQADRPTGEIRERNKMDFLAAAKSQVEYIVNNGDFEATSTTHGYLEAITYALIAIAERLESK